MYRAQVEIGRSIDDTQAAYDAARRGVPATEWCELYFQTAVRPIGRAGRPAPMSVFAQFVPYQLATGTWESRRDEIADAVLAAIARFAPDVPTASSSGRCSGPPTSRSGSGSPAATSSRASACPTRCGTAGSHPASGVDGVYLCGAATHPGGSVMAINGRNAAMAVLADTT